MIKQYGTIVNETIYGTPDAEIIYGGGADSVYTSALDMLTNAGSVIAGYIYSGYGSRPLSEVENDISFIYSVYPQMNYVFIDETSSQSSDLNRYAAIADYAHSLGLQVILNCGVLPDDTGYFNSADIVIVTENSLIGTSSVEEAYGNGIDASKIAALGYSIDISNVVTQTQSYFDAGAGYAYVTEDGKNNTNPWDTLSASFLDEVSVATQYGGKILLPLYIHPSDVTAWQSVAQVGSSCIAIFNPSNGPQSGNDTIHAGDGNDTLYGLEENDILYGDGGDDILYGGAEDDKLYGGTGNDLLCGESGKNTLVGSAGDDTYIVYSHKETITEKAHEGNDTIQTSLDAFSLVKYLTIENLQSISETGTILTGNKYANTLIGRTGADTLIGAQGNDILTGGGGSDTFAFDTKPNATANVDTITDFSIGEDRIRLENTIFKKLSTTGVLNPQYFAFNDTGTAQDADDYIVYNTATGALYYDRDGIGKAAAMEIAVIGIGSHPLLSADDISVM